MSGMMMAAASAGGVSGLDPDAAAFIARFTVPPSAPRTAAINTLFLAMKSAGVFSKLDSMYLFAAHDQQAALLDLIRPTKQAEPIWVDFTADVGFSEKSGYTSGWMNGIRSHYTPSIDAINFTKTSGFVGGFFSDSWTGSGSGGWLFGADDSGWFSTAINKYDTSYTSLQFYLALGAPKSTSIGAPYLNMDKTYLSITNTAGTLRTFKDAVDLGGTAYTSRDVCDRELSILAKTNQNGLYASDPAAAGVFCHVFAVGGYLTDTEQSDFKTALDAYFAAL